MGDEILFQVSGFVTLTYTWGKNPIRQQDKQNNQWSFLCTSHMKMHLEKNKLEVLCSDLFVLVLQNLDYLGIY